MTDQTQPAPAQTAPTQPYFAEPQLPVPASQVPSPAPYGAPPVHYSTVGKIRPTGLCILLMIVTLGIYSAVWFYSTHHEMKRHTGNGLGGGLALVLSIFVGIVMPYITSSEVGGLYQRAGQRKPVSGATGLWYLPGMFIVIGPLVWFVKTNGALNAYWRSQGAR